MKSQITCLSLNPCSDKSFLSTSFDGTLWIFENYDQITRIISANEPENKKNWTLSACWSNSGETIYIGRRNEKIDVVDVTSGKISTSLKLLPDSGWVSNVLVFPNDRHLLICSNDTCRLWDLNASDGGHDNSEQALFTNISGHSSAIVSSAIISRSNGILMIASGSRGYEGLNSSNLLLLHEIFPKLNNDSDYPDLFE